MRFNSPEKLFQGHAVVIAKIAEGGEGDAMLGGLDTADIPSQSERFPGSNCAPCEALSASPQFF